MIKTNVAILVAGGIIGNTLWGLESVKSAQDALTQWVDVEKQLAADENEWAVEKEVIQNSIEFMKEEVVRLEEIISEADETASAGERKREELDLKKAEYDTVMEQVEEAVLSYEAQILEQSKSWPNIFLSLIETSLKRIPRGSQAEDIPLTLRMQNVVVILTQFDKFQGIISKDTEIQEIDGASREVITLYYGLAYAYFVDGSGTYAGYGHPEAGGEEGWEWVTDASLTKKIQDLVAVYDRSKEAVFVDLPAKIVTP